MPSPMIGEIRMFAFGRAPSDWLLCDGSAQRISDYDTLFVLLGTTYGGDGAETFCLPDMRGRVPVHQGQGMSQGNNLTNRFLGANGGSETVALQVNHMPTHTHSFAVASDPANSLKPNGNLLGKPVGDKMYVAAAAIGTSASGSTADTTTSVAGASTPHENTMPTLTLSYCICAKGYFPSQS
jgi:microcystin-dependent protein